MKKIIFNLICIYLVTQIVLGEGYFYTNEVEENESLDHVFDNKISYYDILRDYDGLNNFRFNSNWFLPRTLKLDEDNYFEEKDEYNTEQLISGTWISKVDNLKPEKSIEIIDDFKSQRDSKKYKFVQKYIKDQELHKNNKFKTHVKILVNNPNEIGIFDLSCLPTEGIDKTRDPRFFEFKLFQHFKKESYYIKIKNRIKAYSTYIMLAFAHAKLFEGSKVKLPLALHLEFIADTNHNFYLTDINQIYQKTRVYKNEIVQIVKPSINYLTSDFTDKEYSIGRYFADYYTSCVYVEPEDKIYKDYFKRLTQQYPEWKLVEDRKQGRFCDIVINTQLGKQDMRNKIRFRAQYYPFFDKQIHLLDQYKLIKSMRNLDSKKQFDLQSKYLLPKTYLVQSKNQAENQEQLSILNLTEEQSKNKQWVIIKEQQKEIYENYEILLDKTKELLKKDENNPYATPFIIQELPNNLLTMDDYNVQIHFYIHIPTSYPILAYLGQGYVSIGTNKIISIEDFWTLLKDKQQIKEQSQIDDIINKIRATIAYAIASTEPENSRQQGMNQLMQAIFEIDKDLNVYLQGFDLSTSFLDNYPNIIYSQLDMVMYCKSQIESGKKFDVQVLDNLCPNCQYLLNYMNIANRINYAKEYQLPNKYKLKDSSKSSKTEQNNRQENKQEQKSKENKQQDNTKQEPKKSDL